MKFRVSGLRKRGRLSAKDESNVLGVCPRPEKVEDDQNDQPMMCLQRESRQEVICGGLSHSPSGATVFKRADVGRGACIKAVRCRL